MEAHLSLMYVISLFSVLIAFAFAAYLFFVGAAAKEHQRAHQRGGSAHQGGREHVYAA